MDEQTLIALQGSIAKWQGIVDGAVEELGPDNCPLCQLFNRYANSLAEPHCKRCPVAQKVGDWGCDGTPYEDYQRADENCDKNGVEIYFTDEERLAAMQLHAKRELEFLKSLLPENAP